MVLAACFLVLPVETAAQSLPTRIEIAFGGRWSGGVPLGAADATATTASGGSFRLFSTRSELASMPAVEGRLGARLWRELKAEVSASYGASDLNTEVTLDVEGATDATVSEPVRQFAVEGSIVAELTAWRLGRRTVPFVSAGAGYLRHIHEGGTLVETGAIYQAGGGIEHVLHERRASDPRQRAPVMKSIGLRADIRAVVRTGGVAPGSNAHVAPALGASLFFRF